MQFVHDHAILCSIPPKPHTLYASVLNFTVLVFVVPNHAICARSRNMCPIPTNHFLRKSAEFHGKLVLFVFPNHAICVRSRNIVFNSPRATHFVRKSVEFHGIGFRRSESCNLSDHAICVQFRPKPHAMYASLLYFTVFVSFVFYYPRLEV